MTTAMMIAELMPLHDDELVADIDMTFAAIDRDRLAARERAQVEAMLFDVDWLVAEMLAEQPRIAREALDISLELTPEPGSELAETHTEVSAVSEVA